MIRTFSNDLAEDFEKLYETKEHYDTIIMVGEEPNIEKIYAHSIVLYTRSLYFRRALSDKWAERKDGYLILSKPNIIALVFKIILKFLYCGIVDLENEEIEIILKLLVAADELLVQKLIDYVQEFLIENNSKFMIQSPIEMLYFIVYNSQFNELKEAYTDSEDIDQLGETLRKLIKFVRFYQVDRKDFIPKVWAYKHLLPENLIEDILRCYLNPDARPLYHTFPIRRGNFKIDTKLMDEEIALALAKLMGSRHYFNLLYRSNLHGHSSQIFHERCDNKGATIVVAKILNSNTLIGGYNPLDWNGDNVWKQTNDSFLFRIDTDDYHIKLEESHIRDSASGFAIYCGSDYGPSFGEGPDLRFFDNNNILKCKARSYPKLLSISSFTFSSYEVFQVVRNST
ncbi:1267_t:CDS:2 [Dentiscutata heterogama]|uniref:1267_t:CDS:1 n=1 Tax=Dentiscutata heterogama TaxID=1316150 RepID=A0ACA9KCS8_9GLOM|nr:1267_t:CDS:2 [Dentiscutata heterogama]